ncbi:MAG: cytidylate kinase [Candidatus Parcubacteria bacterium]|jgi:cytidylate kinase
MSKIVSIAGPKHSWKRTIALLVAKKLGYRLFDRALLYRAAVIICRQENIFADEVDRVNRFLPYAVGRIDVQEGNVFIDGHNAMARISPPRINSATKRMMKNQQVAYVLADLQKKFAENTPGLVAYWDGHIQCVFDEPKLRVFLDRNVQARAEYFHAYLIRSRIHRPFPQVLEELKLSDCQYRELGYYPDVSPPGVHRLNCNGITIDAIVEKIVALVRST